MGKKSKNSKDGQIFTRHERDETKRANSQGLQAVKVGSDFYNEPTVCLLCLTSSSTPLICQEGHVYCKGCIYENILRQKDDIRAQEKEYETQQLLEQNKKVLDSEKEHALKIEQFQQDQSSFATSTTPNVHHTGNEDSENLKQPRHISGYKAITTDDGKTHYVVDKEAKRVQIESTLYPRDSLTNPTNTNSDISKNVDTSPNNSKPIVAFWLPQIAPISGPKKIEKPKGHTICPAAMNNHILRVKHLKPLHFSSFDSTKIKSNDALSYEYMCVSCIKPITKQSTLCALRTCGHVFCENCTKRLIMKDKVCAICDKPCPKSEIVTIVSGANQTRVIQKVCAPTLGVN